MNLDRKKMDVLQELDEILGSMGVKYVLIGALIPEILIDMKEEDGKGYGIRTTNDIDITVKIRDWQEFHQLKERLIADGFQERTGERKIFNRRENQTFY
jgi:predicted nucleotidyltransferase